MLVFLLESGIDQSCYNILPSKNEKGIVDVQVSCHRGLRSREDLYSDEVLRRYLPVRSPLHCRRRLQDQTDADLRQANLSQHLGHRGTGEVQKHHQEFLQECPWDSSHLLDRQYALL